MVGSKSRRRSNKRRSNKRRSMKRYQKNSNNRYKLKGRKNNKSRRRRTRKRGGQLGGAATVGPAGQARSLAEENMTQIQADIQQISQAATTYDGIAQQWAEYAEAETARANELAAERDAIHSELAEAQAAHASALAQGGTDAQAAQAALTADIQAKEADIQRLTDQIDGMVDRGESERTITDLRGDLDDKTTEANSLRADLAALQQQDQGSQDQIAELEAQVERLGGQVEQHQGLAASSESQAQTHSQEAEALRGEVARLREQLAQAEQEAQEANGRAENCNTCLVRIREQVAELRQGLPPQPPRAPPRAPPAGRSPPGGAGAQSTGVYTSQAPAGARSRSQPTVSPTPPAGRWGGHAALGGPTEQSRMNVAVAQGAPRSLMASVPAADQSITMLSASPSAAQIGALVSDGGNRTGEVPQPPSTMARFGSFLSGTQ